MLVKTRGIVLRFTRFGDTSIITSVFTERNGLQSFLVKGIRSAGSRSGEGRTRMALFQPLTILDLVIYQRDTANLQHVREVRCLHPYQNIHGNPVREAIAFFLTELLNKALNEQSEPEVMYQFLETELIRLDQTREGLEHFHLGFMLSLSRQLGFGPQTAEEITGGRVLPQRLSFSLEQLLAGHPHELDFEQRREVLGVLIQFFRDHVVNFGTMKSVEVLREILH